MPTPKLKCDKNFKGVAKYYGHAPVHQKMLVGRQKIKN
jgi:hypothetical protein